MYSPNCTIKNQQLLPMEICFDRNIMKLFTIVHQQIDVRSLLGNYFEQATQP